jgi:hypothetical protein
MTTKEEIETLAKEQSIDNCVLCYCYVVCHDKFHLQNSKFMEGRIKIPECFYPLFNTIDGVNFTINKKIPNLEKELYEYIEKYYVIEKL